MIFHLVSQVRWKSSERTQEKKEEICVRSRNPVFYGKEHENGAWFSVGWHFQRLEIKNKGGSRSKWSGFRLFVVYSRLSVAQEHFVGARASPKPQAHMKKFFSRNTRGGCSNNHLFSWTIKRSPKEPKTALQMLLFRSGKQEHLFADSPPISQLRPGWTQSSPPADSPAESRHAQGFPSKYTSDRAEIEEHPPTAAFLFGCGSYYSLLLLRLKEYQFYRQSAFEKIAPFSIVRIISRNYTEINVEYSQHITSLFV